MQPGYNSKSAFQPVRNTGGNNQPGPSNSNISYPQMSGYAFPQNQFYNGQYTAADPASSGQQYPMNYSNSNMQYNQYGVNGPSGYWNPNTAQNNSFNQHLQPPNVALTTPSLNNKTAGETESNINKSQTMNSESSLSSSPEHSASESSPAGSGVEGGDSESADSDTISGTTNRSEHLNNQQSSAPVPAYNPHSMSAGVNTTRSSVLGKRPTNTPGTYAYPTPVSMVQ